MRRILLTAFPNVENSPHVSLFVNRRAVYFDTGMGFERELLRAYNHLSWNAITAKQACRDCGALKAQYRPRVWDPCCDEIGGRVILQASAERKLTRARTQLLLSHPFFGSLCLRLKPVPGAVRIMATDGRRIVYNPTFVESVPPPILQTLLAHEVMHCALGHHCRRGTRDPKLWNKAADLAINPLLKRNGMELWEGALLDPQYDDLSADEIYGQLDK